MTDLHPVLTGTCVACGATARFTSLPAHVRDILAFHAGHSYEVHFPPTLCPLCRNPNPTFTLLAAFERPSDPDNPFPV